MNVLRFLSSALLALVLVVAIARPIAADSSGPGGLPLPSLPTEGGGLADSIPAPASSFAPVEPPLTGFS
jgi:hypothetical protein